MSVYEVEFLAFRYNVGTEKRRKGFYVTVDNLFEVRQKELFAETIPVMLTCVCRHGSCSLHQVTPSMRCVLFFCLCVFFPFPLPFSVGIDITCK